MRRHLLRLSLLAVLLVLALIGGAMSLRVRHQEQQEAARSAEQAREEARKAEAEAEARTEREAARPAAPEAEARSSAGRHEVCQRWVAALGPNPEERSALESGSLSFGSAEEDALARRITQGKLDPRDMGPRSPAVPCLSSDPLLGSDSFHLTVRRAYGQALLEPRLWEQGREPSPLAVEALRNLVVQDKAAVARFVTHLDRLARAARTDDDRRLARVRCKIAADLPGGRQVSAPNCGGLGR